MRIGLVCPYNIFSGGGVQEQVLTLQKTFEKRGHYVRILTPLPREYEGQVPKEIITLGVSMNTTAFAGTNWQWSVSVDTDAIDEVFEREKFDLLHFHEPWVPVWGRQLLMRSKSANVATMHARFLDTLTAKTVSNVFIPYTKPQIKYFDAFTAVSVPAMEYLLSLKKVPITVVPNGIDFKKYSRRPARAIRNPGMKTILYIGRLEERKGVKFLLKAFSEIAHRNEYIQLLIAGQGPDSQKLRRYVATNEIPRVTFLGFISEDEKIHHLHRADVFCSPAYFGESFGVVLLEAMAADLPVVAGDNPGYQSVMVDRGALSLVNPQDTIDFARRLELMTFDEGLRRLWSKWANKRVKEFDFPKVADQYMKVYEDAIKKSKQRKT
ncbi:glycosyltransferase family 4 protein [Candidatus Saccharibacteria bacterium]|nr:glycosyltransferase family 4 protein [Candidatus Saccharibacteria bacterium]